MIRNLLASAFVFVASVGGAQVLPLSIDVINSARAERALPLLERSDTLDAESQDFLFFQLELGTVSHDAAPADEKEILHDMYSSLMELETGVPGSQWKMYELLAWMPGTPTPSEVAHVWDDSPVHSEVFYNPDAKWVGYVVFATEDSWVVVMYVVTLDGHTS